MKYFLATLIILITLPLVAQAGVQINEIAWMGVPQTNGQYGEWFELYNDGSESVSLSGWKLYKANGVKLIYTFSGTIEAGAYYLVERTTTTMTDPVPGVGNESGVFSNNGFANTGEDLVLKNTEGSIVQSLLFASGWPAGDAITKKTMQAQDGSWITANPTPKSVNATTTETPEIPDSTTEQVREEVLDQSIKNEEGTIGGINTKESQKEKIPFLQRVKKDPRITFSFPGIVYSATPTDFAAYIALEYSVPTKGIFVWNMGDGEVIRSADATPIRYVYSHPGVYTVTLSYYPSDQYSTPVIWAHKTITVVVPKITITPIDETTIEIKNSLNTSIDMSYWVIVTPKGSAALPAMTILAANATIALSTRSLAVGPLTTVSLATMNGTVIATTKQQSTITSSVRQISRVLGARVQPSEVQTVEESSVVNNVIKIEQVEKQKNRTKNIVIGTIIIVILSGLFFLERYTSGQH